MKMEVIEDADAAALRAAAFIAEKAREAATVRGRFIVAMSGGRSPWAMLRAFADERVPWEKIHVVQVDERVAPEGHADRNLTAAILSLFCQKIYYAILLTIHRQEL